MKRAIVSLATRKGHYIKGVARLGESLRDNFQGDFFAFIGEQAVGSPMHEASNYAFKIHAMDVAFERGYDQVIWLDASCFAICPVQPLFDLIDRDGILMQDSGHFLGTWTNDRTLNYFGISRDDAMGMRMFGNAGMLGIDIHNKKAKRFYEMYRKSMMNGYFHGAWNNNDRSQSEDERCLGHRHDNSCGSAVAHLLGLNTLYHPGDQILQYAGPYDKIANETIIIKARGL